MHQRGRLHGLRDFFRGQGGCQGHKATGESLADAQNIRSDTGCMGGKHLASTTKTGGDLIGD